MPSEKDTAMEGNEVYYTNVWYSEEDGELWDRIHWSFRGAIEYLLEVWKSQNFDVYVVQERLVSTKWGRKFEYSHVSATVDSVEKVFYREDGAVLLVAKVGNVEVESATIQERRVHP